MFQDTGSIRDFVPLEICRYIMSPLPGVKTRSWKMKLPWECALFVYLVKNFTRKVCHRWYGVYRSSHHFRFSLWICLYYVFVSYPAVAVYILAITSKYASAWLESDMTHRRRPLWPPTSRVFLSCYGMVLLGVHALHVIMSYDSAPTVPLSLPQSFRHGSRLIMLLLTIAICFFEETFDLESTLYI